MNDLSRNHIKELYAGWKREHFPSDMRDMFDCIQFLLRELDDAELVFADVRDMCMYILGQPTNTKIAGKIDSYAFHIGHWPQVLGCQLEGSLRAGVEGEGLEKNDG